VAADLVSGRPAPGWYPTGPGEERWWDGFQWTARRDVAVQLAPTHHAGYQVKGVGGGEHLLHLILTICTVGFWLPVWILRSLAGRKRMVEVRR
jgi:hypothetical protein